MLLLKIILITSFTSCCISLNAQGYKMKGIVTDQKDSPVVGATVIIEEGNLITTTDKLGYFEFDLLRVPSINLHISKTGYKHYYTTISPGQNDTISVLITLSNTLYLTDTIEVSTEQFNSRFNQMLDYTGSLRGNELRQNLKLTLAETLRLKTGVSLQSMGPAPSRPVIRGLSGNRVTILEDGIRNIDMSSTSPDHAVTINPFNSNGIEITRGPKVLLHTSTTLGGVLNNVDNTIPVYIPSSIRVNSGTYYESSNKGILGSIQILIPLSNFSFKGETVLKRTSNLNTPKGILNNSAIENEIYSGGVGFFQNNYSGGISVKEYNSRYGIPGGFVGTHPNGVNIDILSRNYSLKSKINLQNTFINNLELNFNRTYFNQVEYESNGSIGSEFVNYDYQLELIANDNNGISGIYSQFRDFKIGGFVFTPPSKSLNLSTFYFRSLNAGNFEIEFSGRYEFNKITPEFERFSPKIGFIRERTFNSISISASINHLLTEQSSYGLIISRSSRVPTIEELYSEGPHLAAYSYEIGNPELQIERGFGYEFFTDFYSPKFRFNLSGFYYDFQYFIFPRNTGEINFQTLLPVYESSGMPASILGFEAILFYRLPLNMTFTSNLSYTYGMNKSNDSPLPSIPPLRSVSELKFESINFTAGLTLENALKQNRIDEFEETTNGYSVFNLFALFDINSSRLYHSFTISLDNIFNIEYRNHLSRIKSILPEAGRSLRIVYKLSL